MSPNLVVEFTKMQGAGNDFIIVDNRWYRFSGEELASLAARWCPRRFGIGADGLLAFEDDDEADFRMRYVNADGSPATMCGNGARCLARYAVSSGVEGPDVTFATDAGTYRAHVPNDPAAMVRLYVPNARRFRKNVDLDRGLPGGLDAVHYVWTGTEHLVAFVDGGAEALDRVPVDEWGRRLRTDPALEPKGANANFAVRLQGEEETTFAVRTYEKGVEGETHACGTGVLAVATVARKLDLAGSEPITIETRGGRMRVGHAETPDRPDHLYLEGPATTVFRGTFEV
jgi:diaminopimelate epimerase